MGVGGCVIGAPWVDVVGARRVYAGGSMKARSGPPILARMILSILVLGAVAVWDERRESAAALEDFAEEQASLAREGAVVAGTAAVAMNTPRLKGADRDGKGVPIPRPESLKGSTASATFGASHRRRPAHKRAIETMVRSGSDLKDAVGAGLILHDGNAVSRASGRLGRRPQS